MKLNDDGSAFSNSGRIGARGIIQNSLGEMLIAFATPLGEVINNKTEWTELYLA